MSKPPRKPVKWVGSAKRDLDAMPDDVKDVFGHAIDLAQAGGKHLDAKIMAGFGSAGVLEVVEDFSARPFAPFTQLSLLAGSTYCTASKRNPKPGSRHQRKTWS